MSNATSTTAMAIIATLMRSTVTTSESITTAQWHLNENSTVFGSANETDTFPMLILPMSVVGRHGKQQHSHSSHPEHFSPVLLSSEWRPLSRLVFLTIMSCIGGVGNIFMISSVMVEDQLKKAGNSFIVNIGLSDLIVSIVVIPISIVSLLAMNRNEEPESSLSVCKFQWFLAACTFLISILTLAVTSIENYMRLCTSQDGSQWFGRSNVTACMLLIWLVGFVASGLQFAYNVSFNYCDRKSNQHLSSIETGVLVTLILVPLLITFFVHIRIIIDAKKFMSHPSFKPSMAYKSDFSLVRSNFYSFLTFVIFWLPFIVIFALSFSTSPRNISNKAFYMAAWIGLSKSCFHNLIYCMTNRHFRNAYFKLFNYCCCKTTVSTTRRRQEVTRSDVRVHIIPGYNMYSYTSPQRSGTHSKRDCYEL